MGNIKHDTYKEWGRNYEWWVTDRLYTRAVW